MSFLIGLISGIFGGLVGLGGGVVMIPLMTRLLGISQASAHGTSLAIVIFAGLSGACAYAMEGTVDFTAALILAVTASLTARVGARYCASLPEWKLKRYFGCVLLAAVSPSRRKAPPGGTGHNVPDGRARDCRPCGHRPCDGFHRGAAGNRRRGLPDRRDGPLCRDGPAHRTGKLAAEHGSGGSRRFLDPLAPWERGHQDPAGPGHRDHPRGLPGGNCGQSPAGADPEGHLCRRADVAGGGPDQKKPTAVP